MYVTYLLLRQFTRCSIFISGGFKRWFLLLIRASIKDYKNNYLVPFFIILQTTLNLERGGQLKKRTYQKIHMDFFTSTILKLCKGMACFFLVKKSVNRGLIGGSSSNVLFFNQTYNNFLTKLTYLGI